MSPNYRPVPNWGYCPEGLDLVEVAAVAADSHGRIFVFNRGPKPVVILDAEGRCLGRWGEGEFVRPHGLTIAPDDTLYLTDDMDHTVRRYTADGRLLATFGVRGVPSDTGHIDFDYRTIARGGAPFRHPTNLAIAAYGGLFVTDGYGNARVHHFAADGTLRASWGQPGTGPGEFQIPHGIAIDGRGRVIVADRENSRLQFFSQDGEFLEQWTDVLRPCEVYAANGRIYVAELGWRAGVWPWLEPPPGVPGGRVSIFEESGTLLARWGDPDPLAPEGFYALHDISLDASGALYLGEVTISAGGKPDYPCLRKYVPA